jgi:membrane-associated phospholipid phosphatase
MSNEENKRGVRSRRERCRRGRHGLAGAVCVVGLLLAALPALGQATGETAQTKTCTDLEGRPQACPLELPRPEAQAAGTRGELFRRDLRELARGVGGDQRWIWTSPARLRLQDAAWLTPMAGIATGLMMTDRTAAHEFSRGGGKDAANLAATAGVAGLAVGAGALYALGLERGDAKARESGRLSLEAATDALAFSEVLGYGFGRERPDQNGGAGRFFHWGDSSFPSAHTATAFAMATVLAQEYPQPLKQAVLYGLATGVGLARVKAERHFPSDVFVGGLSGYLIGRGVYRRHRDPTLAMYGTFAAPEEERAPGASPGEEREASPGKMSSTYIELDSWMYPALERLVARGVASGAFLGLRPWTRMAAERMLAEVDESGLDGDTAALVAALRQELKRETRRQHGAANRGLTVDQIYNRTQYIAGTPLNDSYHFGATVVNDFGRPYGQGWQQINGFQTRAENGRFSFFVRGEYQHSPGVAGYGAAAAQQIAVQDNTPVQTYRGRGASDAFRLLDTYVSMKLLGHEISVGKQSYWWGPDASTAMLLSNNAAPFYALRINRTTPLRVPLLSRLLGPFRYDNFFGKLQGHQFPPNVFFYGQKVNFEPTPNLELGFARDAVIGGTGNAPLTFGTFWTSFSSMSSGLSAGPPYHNRAGERHASFDFRYRLPGLRNWVTLYADSLVHDDVSPVDAPRRAAVMPGIYLTKFPGLRKLDLHVEGGTTDTTTPRAKGGQFYYYEAVFRDGYTNQGALLGSWLGREGTGGQAWLTYWLGPQSTVQAGFRTVKTSRYFVAGGESQSCAYGELHYALPHNLALEARLQVERWRSAVLAAGPQVDVTTQIGLSFDPRPWLERRGR